MMTAYDLYYEEFRAKGYSHLYSTVCAVLECEKLIPADENYPNGCRVDIPGVGECVYTGD